MKRWWQRIGKPSKKWKGSYLAVGEKERRTRRIRCKPPQKVQRKVLSGYTERLTNTAQMTKELIDCVSVACASLSAFLLIPIGSSIVMAVAEAWGFRCGYPIRPTRGRQAKCTQNVWVECAMFELLYSILEIDRVRLVICKEKGANQKRIHLFSLSEGLFFYHLGQEVNHVSETNPHNEQRDHREREKRGMSPVVSRNICLCRTNKKKSHVKTEKNRFLLLFLHSRVFYKKKQIGKPVLWSD